ncbi:MAG: helix-turn-helix domain-containing protein [Patescibacteria group bacterium]
MISGFSKKKIKEKKTLAERLKSSRLAQDISLSDAEAGTKVRAKFLAALEDDRWNELPSSVYVRGFVLAYAKFLSIKNTEILKLYETELNLKRNVNHHYDLAYKNSFKETKALITPKLVGFLFMGFFIFSMFGYIFYQVSNFAGSPDLKVLSPNNNALLDDDSIEIRGLVDNDSILTVNEETVPITNDGHFFTNLRLHRGVNIIKVSAKNKAQKETSEVLTLEYKPKTALIDSLQRDQ